MLKNLSVSSCVIRQSRSSEILTTHLESLILKGARGAVHVFTGLLEANKDLKVLHLILPDIHPIIERLNLPNSTSSPEESGLYICPRLKTLRVEMPENYRSNQAWLEEKLATLVICRQVANIPLDELAYCCYLNEQECHWMDLVKISEGILDLAHD